MLQSLHVKNLALIYEIEVEFAEGLNILPLTDQIFCVSSTQCQIYRTQNNRFSCSRLTGQNI